ncbi:PREDICTED: Meckel syndrome type 1 protein [Bactrocera latifrons]|uniref:Meckel syndrome type 1 protein n=1 Tax=Bactrocera latifrons TaxID=174628 RepID=UPI0008DCE214|nr:PREDICTED: Meckel syndrome type 1 protein [Bactrocera latifrons]
MSHIFPKHTGIYNILDNIEYLELEVHFRHINSLLKLPKFDRAFIGTNINSLTKNIESFKQTEDATCLRRIRWQEKLLSPSEIELYKDERICLTDTQKKYNQWLLEAGVSEVSSGHSSSVNVGNKRCHKKRNKKSRKAEFSSKERWGEIFTYVHEDDFHPDNGALLSNGDKIEKQTRFDEHVAAQQFMYIFAAISPDTQLVSLAWYPELRQLHIYPDFNDFAVNPYYIQVDTDYRHLYAFAVHNVSKRRHVANPTTYLRLPELTAHWQEERDLNTLFDLPPKRTTRISFLFELRQASGFSYDNIHVRYQIKLPANTILEEGVLNASTHASSPGPANIDCFFGYNWQLTLLCEEHFDPAHLLHIYFEVISIDSWGRERIEGYAHYSTYLSTGSNSAKLMCLCPADGILETLTRYLIGGRRLFDFMSFYTDNDRDTLIKSRYGCRIQTTGQLELNCQCFRQRHCELLTPCTNKTSGMTLDDIMLAYRESRRRLEAVVLK